MKLQIFRSFWGMEGTDEEKMALIAEDGYDGCELHPPDTKEEALALKRLADRFGLLCIPQIHTEGNHFESFRRQAELSRWLNPPLIVSHTGRDTMTREEVRALFDQVAGFEAAFPIPVAHETHRGRPTFSPWTTNFMLRQHPSLRLTADFSHWCCVCESLLEDQDAAMILPIARTIHLHARVGYAQGPQVPDPAAPEYAQERHRHEAWWTAIARGIRERGAEVMTATVEYGPPPYLHTLPHTGVPVADQRRLCLWQKARLHELLDGV